MPFLDTDSWINDLETAIGSFISDSLEGFNIEVAIRIETEIPRRLQKPVIAIFCNDVGAKPSGGGNVVSNDSTSQIYEVDLIVSVITDDDTGGIITRNTISSILLSKVFSTDAWKLLESIGAYRLDILSSRNIFAGLTGDRTAYITEITITLDLILPEKE